VESLALEGSAVDDRAAAYDKEWKCGSVEVKRANYGSATSPELRRLCELRSCQLKGLSATDLQACQQRARKLRGSEEEKEVYGVTQVMQDYYGSAAMTELRRIRQLRADAWLHTGVASDGRRSGDVDGVRLGRSAAAAGKETHASDGRKMDATDGAGLVRGVAAESGCEQEEEVSDRARHTEVPDGRWSGDADGARLDCSVADAGRQVHASEGTKMELARRATVGNRREQEEEVLDGDYYGSVFVSHERMRDYYGSGAMAELRRVRRLPGWNTDVASYGKRSGDASGARLGRSATAAGKKMHASHGRKMDAADEDRLIRGVAARNRCGKEEEEEGTLLHSALTQSPNQGELTGDGQAVADGVCGVTSRRSTTFAAGGPRHTPLISDGLHRVDDGLPTIPEKLDKTGSQSPDYNEKNEGGPARHSRRAGMEVLPYAAQQAERLDTLRHRPQQSQTPVASADSATHNSGPEAPRLGAVSAEVPVRASDYIQGFIVRQ
jgi:hypothetical protein